MRDRSRVLPGTRGRLTVGDAIAEAWTAVRYAVVGASSALVYIGTAIVLERTARIGLQAASVLAYTVSAIFAYAGHHSVTFAADGRHYRYAPRFLALVIIGYTVSLLLPKLLVERHLTSYAVATLAVVFVNAVAGYLINRTLVFRRTHGRQTTQAPRALPAAHPADGPDEAITTSSPALGGPS